MHVMLDLETLGTRPGSVFFSIGACAFCDGQIVSKFYTLISPSDAVKHGLTIDPETLAWWLRQSDDARAQLTQAFAVGVPLKQSLADFAGWLQILGPTNSLRVWGNGSDFDNAILAEGYTHFGFQTPWKFWNNRCYRTVKSMRPDIEIKRSGVHHNALDDAIDQANHLMQIVPGFGLNSY